MKKCKLCGKDFNIWIEINGIKKNVGKRKYCLDCSPFGKHNTRPLKFVKNYDNKYSICIECEKQKPLSEFGPKGKNRLESRCKLCAKEKRRKEIIEKKKKAIKYKGGKCIKCGYSKYYGALDFYHKNSKYYIWNKLRKKNWGEIIKELDNCHLYCSRCHREEHQKPNNEIYNKIKTSKDLYKYQIIRWIKIKKKAIEYKGGKCIKCGYDKYYGAMDFHHIDSKKKDIDWKKLKLKSWDKITKELDKCLLYCNRCHQEIHGLERNKDNTPEAQMDEQLVSTQQVESSNLSWSTTK